MIEIIPKIGLGTYGLVGEDGLSVILSALEIGYRHLDTAQSYGSEHTVGKAIRACGLSRDEVFVTTKVAQANLDRTQFIRSVDDSLRTMQLEMADLVLIHWPSIDPAVPFESYIEDLGRIQEMGKTRLIGVSNFPIALMEQAESILGSGRLHADQVEIHPFLQNRKLVDFALSKAIVPTAYMPLAKGRVSEDPVLTDIAAAHDASAAQVTLAWLMQRGIAVIPASGNPERQKSNFAAQDITLSDAEMGRIAGLDRGSRFTVPKVGPAWD